MHKKGNIYCTICKSHIYLEGNNMFKNIFENQERYVKSAVKISGEIMS